MTEHTIQTQTIAQSDAPSYINLVTVTVPIDDGEPSISRVKTAIERLRNIVFFDVHLDRPHSQYDCTGQHFTTSLERIKWFVYYGVEGKELVAIYTHHVSIDV